MKNFREELENLKSVNQFRQIPDIEAKDGKYIFSQGKKYLNLSSNDYLGFGCNRDFEKEFLDFAKNFDDTLFSSASARLLTGNHKVFVELENYVAKILNKERCLLFNSGYHANVGMISALCGKGCAVFSDKLNHASIIDGMKLAEGDFYRYRHLDYAHLEQLLAEKASKYEQVFIISESVFSMDGDIADISKLVELKQKFGAILIIDDAHGFGIFGQNGYGVCENIQGVDLVIATFGKALGSYGAFVAGDAVLIEYLINKARSFIFSTAIPPLCAMWTLWLLKNKLPKTAEVRKNLLDTAQFLRVELASKGLETKGESHIIPVITGNNDKTVQLAEKLREEGFWILPIRPPTVPLGSSRLRISLTALVEKNDIKALPELIKKGLE